MRIISGKYKGRRFTIRKNFPSRPTTDFAKENIFNVIENHFDLSGANVLDLFAGTGSISFEFASRGAAVDLIEMDHRSMAFIKKNIASLKIGAVKPITGDVFRLVKKICTEYDLVFADPPFTLNNTDNLPDLIFECDLLKVHGWFILEHSAKHSFKEHRQFRELRKYGSVHFSIFSR
ncbi:MAG: RsmD family RNA methyltransferase [Bacteroidales bacterium]